MDGEQIEAIVSKSRRRTPQDPPELFKVVVALCKDTKQISSLVKEISQYSQSCPSHLKRVLPPPPQPSKSTPTTSEKKRTGITKVLICSENDWTNVSKGPILQALEVEIVDAPLLPPLSREQAFRWTHTNHLWPSSSRPLPLDERPPSPLSLNEIELAKKFMLEAINEAKLSFSSGNVSHLLLLFSLIMRPVGCVAVNPNTMEIVAKGRDLTLTNHNPLKHACMNCIDNISMVKKTEYACTGLYLYSTLEPCAMCSMACVHSRFKKVFFGMKSKHSGGLCSCCSIHLEPFLNHHFEVWSGILVTQCESLFNSSSSK